MLKYRKGLLAAILFTGLTTTTAYAADLVKPFILANSTSGDVASCGCLNQRKINWRRF